MSNPCYCSQGHENPGGSRFCLQCGERLEAISGIQPGQKLSDRYLIIRQLGQGGFGRTYLAEDANRFQEPCVLKEFSPQVQTPYILQKAEELFQREAGVLYKLQHPQIPRFRELFRVNINGKGYLFLVQDYVEGQTYRAILETRKQHGSRFSEMEANQLLLSILPVLEYIHRQGVIHRDIAPDNLMLRQADQLPMLIDFGGVKQVAANVASQYYQPGAVTPNSGATLLGKVGYAPPEQMMSGNVYPHSDLYALAATILVLLTGKEPQELIDPLTLNWNWRQQVNLSPNLGLVLDRMLAQQQGQRYQSAEQVLIALNPPAFYPPTQPIPPQIPTYPPTQPIPQIPNTVAVVPPTPYSPPPTRSWWTPGKVFLAALVLTGAVGGIAWLAKSRLQPSQPQVEISPQPSTSPEPQSKQPTPEPQLSPEEISRREKLRTRRQDLGIDYDFYISLVNQFFWDKNPSLRGRKLSDGPEDASLRVERDKTASEVLEKLAPLSSESRKKLGSYTSSVRDRWKVQVNDIHVGRRSLYQLGDAAFFQYFPEQQGKKFIDQPVGQVWHGFVNDQLNAILAGTAFKRIVFDKGANGSQVSGTLKGSQGKVFIAGLAQGQMMKLKLDASSKILFSVYSPTGKVVFLEDSSDRTWSGTLPENGFYEFVLVSTASSPLDYQFNITVDDPTPPITSTPSATDTPTSTPTASPTATP